MTDTVNVHIFRTGERFLRLNREHRFLSDLGGFDRRGAVTLMVTVNQEGYWAKANLFAMNFNIGAANCTRVSSK
jgi:hypothetical protein